MTPFLRAYLACWLLFCALAALLAAKYVRVPLRDVRSFLLAPWKLALFVPGIVFVTLAGHFTDDETWDIGSGGIMSICTVLTAWWATGTFARVIRGRAPIVHVVIAIAVTLFSSSWCYDGYLLLRDGAYTQRWLGNLMLSPTIYLCAGVITNLEIQQGRLGVAWTRDPWPAYVAPSRWWPLVLAAIPFVIIATYFLVGFVGWHIP
jgi:hypothetical protein